MLMSASPGTSVDLRNSPKLTSEGAMTEGREYSNDHCIVIMNYRFLAMRYEYLTERERQKTQLTGISLKPNPLLLLSHTTPTPCQKTHGHWRTQSNNFRNLYHHAPPSRRDTMAALGLQNATLFRESPCCFGFRCADIFDA
jgi:hypothetical protein